MGIIITVSRSIPDTVTLPGGSKYDKNLHLHTYIQIGIYRVHPHDFQVRPALSITNRAFHRYYDTTTKPLLLPFLT